MSCFLTCFRASKHNNGCKKGRKLPPHDDHNFGDHWCKTVSAVNVADKEDHSQKRVNLVADSRVTPPEEQLSLVEQVKQPAAQLSLTEQAEPEEQFSSGTQKKVTFDSNVKEYNHVSVAEAPGNVLNNEIEVNQNNIKLGKSSSLSESGSTVSSLGLYPPNHRYQNCQQSDDDEEELDDDVSGLDEDEEDDLEPRTESPATHEVNDGHHYTHSNSLTPEMKIATPGFNHGIRDRAGYINSVMNPIENTSQWRRVKRKGTSRLKEKENFRIASDCEPKSKDELAVNASLSNWLVSTHKTSISQERPILGPPSGSPDEKPLVGTVGVHWNDRTPTDETVSTSSFKGIPNTTSKYREDRKVNWHSTPFEKRLERALNSGSAEAYATHRSCT